MKEKLGNKDKRVGILIIAIVLIILIFLGSLFFKSSNKGKDKFEKAYNDLKTECTINSCTSQEYNSKLQTLKDESGLTNSEIDTIINK